MRINKKTTSPGILGASGVMDGMIYCASHPWTLPCIKSTSVLHIKITQILMNCSNKRGKKIKLLLSQLQSENIILSTFYFKNMEFCRLFSSVRIKEKKIT